MSIQNRKRKFTKSIAFKVLCGLVILLLLGIGYNLIVDDKDSPLSEEEQEEEQQRTADKDTIDIVGDYLWPHAKSSKDDLTAKDDKDKDADEAKDKTDKADKAKSKESISHQESNEAPMAAPASPAPTTPDPEPSGKSSAPTIEKMNAPKIERID